MPNVHAQRKGRTYLYAALTIVLVMCLAVGWRDFTPWIPQSDVREHIQLTVRVIVQTTLQFIVPAAIIGFFIREAAGRLRTRQ